MVNAPEISKYPVAFRVTSMDLGSLTSNRITLDVAQDVFGLSLSLYTPLGGTEWKNETVVPKNALNVSIFEVPSNAGTRIAISANSEPGAYFGYYITKRVGEESYVLGNSSNISAFSDNIVLDSDLTGSSDEIPIKVVSGDPDLAPATVSEIREGHNIALIYNSANELQEFIAFEEVAMETVDGSYTLSGVWRGLLDTTAKPHEKGSRVIFLEAELGMIKAPQDPTKMHFKLLPESVTETLDFAVADEYE